MFEVTVFGEKVSQPRRIEADQVSVDPHWVKFTMSQMVTPEPDPLYTVEIDGSVYQRVDIRRARRVGGSPLTVAIFPASRVSSILRLPEELDASSQD